MTVSAAETALHLRALAEAKRRQGQQRAERLLASVPRAHSILVEHGARRVWLFGSLIAGLPSAESDVDLAVEGLETSRYFHALADLMELFHGPVDLVRIEDAAESLRVRVLSEGREL